MDNHPIPQDVTGFQFRLIGDMTVKQFAYVAAGGILAVVFLYAPFPFLMRIPFMTFFGGLGAALAFLPIEGRPLDIMIGYFLKALLSPNQYAYHKTGGQLSLFAYESKPQAPQSARTPQTLSQKSHDKEAKLQAYLTSLHAQNLSPLDKREVEFMQRLFPQAVTSPTNVPTTQRPNPQVQPQGQIQNLSPQVNPRIPQEEQQEKTTQKLPDETRSEQTPTEKTSTLSLQENVLNQELNHAKQEEAGETDTTKKQAVHSHVTELERQLMEIQKQKEELERQLQALKSTNEPQDQPTPQPSPSQPVTQTQQPNIPTQQTQAQEQNQQASVRKIPAEMAKGLGLPHLPEVPNLILGIVKDPRGNVLKNILVEVKDKDGTPARAFRTNQLGQFASATPLSNGTYTIEFEDPKDEHRFDSVEITAQGEILMPIEIISHDEREELRKALFN